MQAFARTSKKNAKGDVVGSGGYTAAEVETALKAGRFELWRHELMRYTAPMQRLAAFQSDEAWSITGGTGSLAFDSQQYKQGQQSLRLTAAASGSLQATFDLVDQDLSAAAFTEFRIWVLVPDPTVTSLTLRLDSTGANFTNYWTRNITEVPLPGGLFRLREQSPPTPGQNWIRGKWSEVKFKKTDLVVAAGAPTFSLVTRLSVEVFTTGSATEGKAFFDDWRLTNPGASAWLKMQDLTTVESAAIEYARDGRVKRSGRYRLRDDAQVDYLTDVVRTFWLLRMPDGNFAEWVMGTFYPSAPVKPLKPGAVREVEVFDALLALEQAKLADWLKVVAGTNVVTKVRTLITDHVPSTPPGGVSIPATTVTLDKVKVFEPGENVLTVCNELLRYANYAPLRANEMGSFESEPHVRPSKRAVEFTYKDDLASVIVSGSAEVEQDVLDVPNQWVRVASRPEVAPFRTAYTLTDPSNPYSTTVRGRTITDYGTVDIKDQATLDKYVARLAEEGQLVSVKVRLATPPMPHGHADIIRIDHSLAPEYVGTYVERRWTLQCRAGGRMTHELDQLLTAATD